MDKRTKAKRCGEPDEISPEAKIVRVRPYQAHSVSTMIGEGRWKRTHPPCLLLPVLFFCLRNPLRIGKRNKHPKKTSSALWGFPAVQCMVPLRTCVEKEKLQVSSSKHSQILRPDHIWRKHIFHHLNFSFLAIVMVLDHCWNEAMVTTKRVPWSPGSKLYQVLPIISFHGNGFNWRIKQTGY